MDARKQPCLKPTKPLVAVVAVMSAALFMPATAVRAQCMPEVTAEIDNAVTHNLGTGDFTGYSVAMDGERAVVAAPWDNRETGSPVADAGSLRVFVRSGGTWVQQGSPFFASDPSAADLLGWDVDISGNRIVASTVNGEIYVFTYNGSSWPETAKFTSPDAPINNNFARSIAIDGDTIVAGAPFDTLNDDVAGAIYIFVFNGTSWTLQAKLRPSDSVPFGFQQMGTAVAIDGDTVVAGAPSGSSGQDAYVFVRSGISWLEQAKLTPAVANGFGESVAIHGDRILVGGPTDGTGGASGSVFFFTRSGSTWTEEDKVPGIASSGNFGNAVDLYGDAAIVGEHHATHSSVSNAGRAHFLINNAGDWSIQASVNETEDIDANDEFGTGVAIYGDAAVVGAPSDNWTNLVGTTFNDTGAATFYDVRCEGACCVNGNCVLTSVGDCNALGGTFQGLGASCSGVTCAPGCCPGDMNGDESIDGLDAQALVDALMQGATCP
jgi:hypothetical protein